MKRLAIIHSLVWCVLLYSTMVLKAENSKYWIFFRDKGPEAKQLLKASTLDQQASALGITERALLRRLKVLPPEKVISSEDYPVSKMYLADLSRIGIAIEQTSRWFNAATAFLAPDQISVVRALSFVEYLEPVTTFRQKDISLPPQRLQKPDSLMHGNIHDYGPSYGQLNQIRVPEVHNLRITGNGVLLGMLDSGFRWRTHEATQNMHVIAEYDFIQKDGITENQPSGSPIDESNQDYHGTVTMSVAGGYKGGQLIGPAYGADFMLAKTEYVPTETNVEEDNWVAGIEWLELNGADVASSSLGYGLFDTGQKSYTYYDMNGRTAKTSIAATIAARKGVVVCNSMGNKVDWQWLTAPADADSIISVGAVTADGRIASFSGLGPTADGRMKPDVVAQGVSTYAATTSKLGYVYEGGTSLSTPLVAGSAALLLSAHPELTPIQVRDALRKNASNATTPDTMMGWGIANVYEALLSLGLSLSTDPEVTLTPDSNTRVSIYVIARPGIKKDSVSINYSVDQGTSFSRVSMTLVETLAIGPWSGKYSGVIPKQTTGSKIRLYLSAVDANNAHRTSPYNAPHRYFEVTAGTTNITTISLPTDYQLYQNYPNPFNPTTTIRYELARPGLVTLKVYDILGRLVTTLIDEPQSSGTKLVIVNGRNLPSGVYYYTIRSGDWSSTKRMMLVK